MVSAIGSVQSGLSLYEMIQAQSSSSVNSTDFEELISAADDSGLTDDSSSDSISSSSESSASQNYDPADLNKDGTVTAEEALMYMQMQMLENMASDMGAQSDSNPQMSHQQMGSGSNNINSLDDLKMKQASGTYSSMQSALDSTLSMSSSLSFAV